MQVEQVHVWQGKVEETIVDELLFGRIEGEEPGRPRADLTGVGPVALLAARLVVAVLAARRGADRLLEELMAGGVSAWRLALRQVPGWGGPWRLLPVQVRRVSDCPGCGPRATAGDLSGLLGDVR